MSRSRGRPKGGWIPDQERKPAVTRFRERHHTIAKLLACGQTRNQVAELVGMTPERVGQLYNDPSFQDLIAQYRHDPNVVRAQGIDAIAFQREQMVALNQRAMDHYAQRMEEVEEAGESLEPRIALRAIEIFSDRIGLGKHTTQTHVYDFATELENRRIARMKTIEAKVDPPVLAKGPLLLEGAGSRTPAPSSIPSGDGADRRGLDHLPPDPIPVLRRRGI